MKNLKWLALISVIIAIAIFPLMSVFYDTFYLKPFVESLPPHLRPYLNPQPFFSTIYGGCTITVWTFLGFLWAAQGTLQAVKFFKTKRKKNTIYKVAMITIFSLTLLAGLFQIKIAEGRCNWLNEVDVLMMADEEFRSHSDWIENAKNVLHDVSENRFAGSEIAFSIRGWIDWDSNDGESNVWNLYQEAIQECGLTISWIQLEPGNNAYGWGVISGSKWTDSTGNTRWIDLLLVFTGQYMQFNGEGMQALSIPRCNATIVRYDCVNLHVLTHELGHQYYLQHCDDPWCVMNTVYRWGDNFCAGCRAALDSNRDKWMTDPMIYFISNINEGQFVSPVDYTDFIWGEWAIYFTRVKCGTTATVRAEPLDGWILDHYYAQNTPWTYTTTDPNPPPNFTVYEPEFEFTYTDTWTVVAYFNETGSKINGVKAETENGNPTFKRRDFTEIHTNLTWTEEDQPMAFAINITDSSGQMIGFVALCCERYVIGSSQILFGFQIPHFAQPGEARIDCSLWTDWPWEKNARRYGSEKIVTIEITE